MAGKKDISGVTVQVGRFAVHDAFDGNSYSSDPRAHFMNWALWAAGAFDYPADRAGLGYGTFAELNQKDWAFRAGYFLMDKISNSNQFDMNLGKRGGYVAEYERRSVLKSGGHDFRVWAQTPAYKRCTADDAASCLEAAVLEVDRINIY